MLHEKFRTDVVFIVCTVGTIVAIINPEQQVLIVVITAFLVLFIRWSWPEYEKYEQLYNPANKAEKLSQWEIIKEGFLKAGWRVRERVRRKKG